MTREYPLTQSEFASIYSRVPRLCVEAIILDPQKGVLLTKRAIEPDLGMWHTPGGTVFYKEKLTDAVRRIARKELGLDVATGEILGVIEFNSAHNHAVSPAIAVKPLEQTFTINLNAEASEYAFFKTLPKNLIEDEREFLLNLLKDL